MGELRKDYVLDRWVLISTARGKRPKQFRKLHAEHVHQDFFAPGFENLTPPEIGRTGTLSKWRMRWFSNKFTALEPEGQAEIRNDNKFFTYSSSYGYHLVLVETPSGEKQLADLKVSEISELLDVYNRIIADLSKKPNVRYVSVFKNHGPEGGTSIVHSHSQIMALNHVPKLIRDKIWECGKLGSCPYCQVVQIEKDSPRACFENSDFVAFTPYASRFNYEIWVFPKEHIRTLGDVKRLDSLAEIMKKILAKLKRLGCSYNFVLQYAPEGQDLHFHIEFYPRIATWAGFEFGSEEIINSVSPEEAAKFYRGGK